MRTIYLDNAATTPMDPEVIKVMQESMLSNFGNPSSVHQFGRRAKVAIETARKNIAKHFNVLSSEVFFTSGGTEGNNLILQNAVENLNVKRIVTSKIEHHAVLYVVQALQKKFDIEVVYVGLDECGQVDLNELKNILKDQSLKTLVSLMMVNNEIGNLLPVQEVSFLCRSYNALFHSDTVQAIGHYNLDLKENPIDFIVASAHKFHGPKGVGFICVNKIAGLKPMFYGGGQEKGLRSGTENVHAILGMEKALSIAYDNIERDTSYILSLKKYFIEQLKSKIKGVVFNGFSEDLKKSTSTIINVTFPSKNNLLLFNIDLMGIAVSSGSACASGALKGSYVLQEILSEKDLKKIAIRFSFSRMNSVEDLDNVLTRIPSFFV